MVCSLEGAGSAAQLCPQLGLGTCRAELAGGIFKGARLHMLSAPQPGRLLSLVCAGSKNSGFLGAPVAALENLWSGGHCQVKVGGGHVLPTTRDLAPCPCPPLGQQKISPL